MNKIYPRCSGSGVTDLAGNKDLPSEDFLFSHGADSTRAGVQKAPAGCALGENHQLQHAERHSTLPGLKTRSFYALEQG